MRKDESRKETTQVRGAARELPGQGWRCPYSPEQMRGWRLARLHMGQQNGSKNLRGEEIQIQLQRAKSLFLN